MRWLGWLVVCVAACTAPGDADGDGLEDELPYVLDDVAPPAPSLGRDGIEAALQDAFDLAITLDAWPVLDAYEAAMEARDEGCPTYVENGGESYWIGGCATSAGSRFEGFGQALDRTVEVPEGSEWSRTVAANATITTDGGEMFVGGGGAVVGGGHVLADDTTYAYTAVQGTFAWTGDEAKGTWLADETSAELTVIWRQSPTYRAVTLDGTVSTATGDAVHFDEVTLVDVVCGGEPSGTVSLRGEDGWYDVVFDLDLDDLEGVSPASCDGCGAAWYRGQAVGDACVEVADLATFEAMPW